MSKSHLGRGLSIFLALILLNSTPFRLTAGESQHPKNIILFIGDGMGIAHITAAKTATDQLALERFPVAGFLTTHSEDSYITDSAASATALATGFKTNRLTLGMAPDSSQLKNVLEYAEENGIATGLVATASVTHATPAGFAAHVWRRSEQPRIAEQLAESGVDVLIGGGLGYFIPEGPGSLRKDNKDLVGLLKQKYMVVTSIEAFREVETPETLIALLAGDGMPKVKERDPSLVEMTRKAIDILSARNEGFFLMVEGSQIDWEGHDQNSQGIIDELLDFDRAVDLGLDFAEQDGQTLIIVTADHETGGLTLLDGSLAQKTVTAHFSTDCHTGCMVPLFAFGPGAEHFGGMHDNTDIGKALIKFTLHH